MTAAQYIAYYRLASDFGNRQNVSSRFYDSKFTDLGLYG
jgi:hypothetical protein